MTFIAFSDDNKKKVELLISEYENEDDNTLEEYNRNELANNPEKPNVLVG